MKFNPSKNNNINYFLGCVDVVLAVSFFIELFFYFSVKNLYTSLVLVYGWAVIRIFCLVEKNLVLAPVSFFMIMGAAMFYYALPLPMTLLSARPVAFNMRLPYETMTHHAIFATLIAFTHYFYIVYSNGFNPFRNFLLKINFYRQPSNEEIWFTGLVGLCSAFYSYFIMGNWQVEASDRGISYHVTSLLMQFIWMPVLLFFPKLRSVERSSKNIKYVLIYSSLVMVISVASNWRTILFSGVMIFIYIFILGWIKGHFVIKEHISVRGLIFGAFAVYFISGPLMDVSRAMVEVRGNRVNVSAYELLIDTFHAYGEIKNKEESRSFSEKDLLSSYAWNEDYVSNLALNRFVNLKISDNCVFYANEIGFSNPEMHSELMRQLVSMMPNFLLNILDIDVGKKYDMAYSIGDYLYWLATNDSGVLGSAVISSMPGMGLAFFGYYYILFLIPILVLLYIFYDSLAISLNGDVWYSYYFYVYAVSIFNYFNDRHVYVSEIRFFLRGYWESVLLFTIAMFLMRGIMGVGLVLLRK